MPNATPTRKADSPEDLQADLLGLGIPRAARLPRCAPLVGIPISAASPLVSFQLPAFDSYGIDRRALSALGDVYLESADALLSDGTPAFVRLTPSFLDGSPDLDATVKVDVFRREPSAWVLGSFPAREVEVSRSEEPGLYAAVEAMAAGIVESFDDELSSALAESGGVA